MNAVRVGLASVKRRDSSRFRTLLFSKLIEENLTLKIAYRLSQVTFFAPLMTAALAAYSLRRLFQARIDLPADARQIAVYHYSNEKRAVERHAGDSARGSISYSARFSWAPFRALRRFSPRRCRKWLRLSGRLLKKNGFLVGARQTEFLALYGFFRGEFAGKNLENAAFISTSESNPEIISAVLAAKNAGACTVYVTHSALESEHGIFFHDEIRVPADRYVTRVLPHLRLSPRSKIVVAGPERLRSPLAVPDFGSVKKIGIVCSLIQSPGRIKAAVEDALRIFPGAEIVVRPHPNETFAGLPDGFLPASPLVTIQKRPLAAPLAVEALSWDFALAGGSSAHLDLLKLGVPTVHFNVDGIGWDLYHFVESGLVPSVENVSQIPARVSEVYSRDSWREVFRSYSGCIV